jgi:hypothetical protein
LAKIMSTSTTPRVRQRGDVFRMAEFDAIAASRTIADVLRANLESAEAQCQVLERRARLAQRRAEDLRRAVRNWHDVIDDYERATNTTVETRQN